MSKIITISNHKGGVGKTTSTINIGSGLGLLGKKVLLVDLDPQANLTQSLGIAAEEDNIYTLLKRTVANKKSVYSPVVTPSPGVYVIPSTLDLSGAEVELSSEAGREFFLKELLSLYRPHFDYILIDSPPSLGLLTINAFTASDRVIIPIQAEYLALKGLTKLLEIIEKIKSRLNKDLKLGGIFVTQYDNRKILNKDIAEAMEKHYSKDAFKTRIRDNVALAEAPAKGMDIFRYSFGSHGAIDYMNLCHEILKRR